VGLTGPQFAITGSNFARADLPRESQLMDSRFTFDDVLSSKPKSVAVSVKVAQLTQSLARLKTQRAIVAEIRPNDVGKVDQKISAQQSKLQQLTGGLGPRRK
jgi:hypothetical protein